MAEDVSQTTRNKNKGADGERVHRGEPAQCTRLVLDAEGAGNDMLENDALGKTGLNEELRGADDGYEENLTGEGSWALDVGLRELEFMVLYTIVVSLIPATAAMIITGRVGMALF